MTKVAGIISLYNERTYSWFHLLVLGNAYMYDIRGKLVQNFSIIDFSTPANILECLFWGNGIVAITSDMKIFVAEVNCIYSYWYAYSAWCKMPQRDWYFIHIVTRFLLHPKGLIVDTLASFALFLDVFSYTYLNVSIFIHFKEFFILN